jgi:two-component system sensor histidine kinase KdpD
VQSLASLAAVSAVTAAGFWLLPDNPATVGFVYLLTVLIIAAKWRFLQAAVASVTSALCFNFFFLPPVGAFTIESPQHWIAFFSFVITALIASRLSARAEQRARDATDRQRDLERLYAFSRAILLIEDVDAFPKHLVTQLAGIFQFEAVVLYDSRTGELHRAGPAELDGLDPQMRQTAVTGEAYTEPAARRSVTAVRLGADPIASLGLQGPPMPDAVLQGIANLVAIGLERARAQDLDREIEAARRSEQLRTSLIDAMAHEFKTPLTSVKAATTSLRAYPEQPAATRQELITIADEEAERLSELIDDAIEMARLDTGRIEVHLELASFSDAVSAALASLRAEAEGRAVTVSSPAAAPIPMDLRLVTLALKQLIGNALKYSPPATPVTIRVDATAVEVVNEGKAIPAIEQARLFDRFYRSPSIKDRIPGSGLGLSITAAVARAHGGNVELRSCTGETVFRFSLPPLAEGAPR